MAPVKASKQVNRAELVDQAFLTHVEALSAHSFDAHDHAMSGSKRISKQEFIELFESQIVSRHLDLMARQLRIQNKVFYTIGSSGHEGNALLGRLTRPTDPAFLHYRSGALMAERYRYKKELDFILDTALSFAASSEDPVSGGRHKVWGSKPLWVLPQTSTIASHLPKAVGTAMAIEQAQRLNLDLPIPADSIALCSFGDASTNHSTAQGAINAAAWAAHQGLPVPIVFLCEDNGWGVSVKTPNQWIEKSMSQRTGLDYFQVDGLDLVSAFEPVKEAIVHCRERRRPVFLHFKTVRLMGHAGTDFEVDYRRLDELESSEAQDPLLRSASIAIESGIMTPDQVISLYEHTRQSCICAAHEADQRKKLTSYSEIEKPLAPYHQAAVFEEASRQDFAATRVKSYGGLKVLPEHQNKRHLAILINHGLKELLLKYPESLIFGEDVAGKGGVYTVTRQLNKTFGGARVFNTLLDEQTILGLAQGFAYLNMLPIPEIQYLAYFHNACDQIRGEAASMQYFSNQQFQNPMLVRMASLGYQKGFGGHFHNDNSIAALRDIPGVTIACPSRGDDAVMMLRTLMALAKVDGRVSLFLEPIALYMTKDLYEPGDGEWLFSYPDLGKAIPIGEPRIYYPDNQDILIISYGNGIPMSLRASKQIFDEQGVRVRVMDLRWLLPLNEDEIAEHAAECNGRVVIVDEGRRSAGVGEGIITALVEQLGSQCETKRVVGKDCYTPLGPAAGEVLPNELSILEALRVML